MPKPAQTTAQAKKTIIAAQKVTAAFTKALASSAPAIAPKTRKREKEDRIIVVVPDVHGSEMDKKAVAAFLGDLRKLKPDTVVQLGDLNEAAGFSSKHGAATVQDMHYSYAEDVKASSGFLDSVQNVCNDVHVMEGNHDFHIERWAMGVSLGCVQDAELIRRALAPEELMGFKSRGIRYYRRHEMHSGLSTRGVLKIGKMHFTHGILGGGGRPEQVVHAYGVNMFFGHTHRAASAILPNMTGPIGAWNPGCLSKLQPRWRHGDHTKFSHGYGVIHMARSGNFQAEIVSIHNGVSLLRHG